MSSESPKLDLYRQFAVVARAIGNANRLNLLELLAQRERHVEALAGLSDLSVANASQHLQHLRHAGLVVSRKSGKQVVYRLQDDSVLALLAALRSVAEENVAEAHRVIADYFEARDGLEPITREELVAWMRRGLVTLLDVRPEDEFATGHLPHALNIPLKDLRKRLDELPLNQEVIAYCRGAYCVFSFEAVASLRKRGFKARRLEDGYPEWRAAGLPVEGGLETG